MFFTSLPSFSGSDAENYLCWVDVLCNGEMEINTPVRLRWTHWVCLTEAGELMWVGRAASRGGASEARLWLHSPTLAGLGEAQCGAMGVPGTLGLL